MALVFLFHRYAKLVGKTAVFVSAFKGIALAGCFAYIAGVIELAGSEMLALAALAVATIGAGSFSLDLLIPRNLE